MTKRDQMKIQYAKMRLLGAVKGCTKLEDFETRSPKLNIQFIGNRAEHR